MQAIGKFLSYTANSLDITTCANDVIVVRHADGSLHSSPFFVRFGRGHVLRPSDKIVQIEINGEMTEAVMKMGEDGTAFWLEPTQAINGADVGQLESPVGSPNRSPRGDAKDVPEAAGLPPANVAVPAVAGGSTLTVTNTSTNRKMPVMSPPSGSTPLPAAGAGTMGVSTNTSAGGGGFRADASFATCMDPSDAMSGTSPLLSGGGGGGRSQFADPHTLGSDCAPPSLGLGMGEGVLSLTSPAPLQGATAGSGGDEDADSILCDDVDPSDRAHYPELLHSLEASKVGTPLMVSSSAVGRGRTNSSAPSCSSSSAVAPHHPSSFPLDDGLSPDRANNANAYSSDDAAPFARPPLAPSPNHRNSLNLGSTGTPPIAGHSTSNANGMQYSRVGSVGDLVLSRFASADNIGALEHELLASVGANNSASQQQQQSVSSVGSPCAPPPIVMSRSRRASAAPQQQQQPPSSPMEQLKEALVDGVLPAKRGAASPIGGDGIALEGDGANAAGDVIDALAHAASAMMDMVDVSDALPHTPTTPQMRAAADAGAAAAGVYDSDLDEVDEDDDLVYGSEDDEYYEDDEGALDGKSPHAGNGKHHHTGAVSSLLPQGDSASPSPAGGDADGSASGQMNASGGADASTSSTSVHGAANTVSAIVPPLFQRTLTPIEADLKRLGLKEGANIIRYRTTSSLRGTTYIEGRIFLWGQNTKIVVSDVDGTITKSDVLGHILPLVGKDWTHTGICDLYTKCAQNGYQFLYLTARSVSYMAGTRRFLWGIVQDNKRLPLGPVLTAPDRFFAALTTEVSKRSHEFKIACLEGVRRAFPAHVRPYYAGFGNRINDVVAYSATGIPKHKIFIIDHDGVVHVCKVQQTYNNLSHLVHETFPPLKSSAYVKQFPHSYATNNYPGAETSLPAAAIAGVLPGNAVLLKNVNNTVANNNTAAPAVDGLGAAHNNNSGGPSSVRGASQEARGDGTAAEEGEGDGDGEEDGVGCSNNGSGDEPGMLSATRGASGDSADFSNANGVTDTNTVTGRDGNSTGPASGRQSPGAGAAGLNRASSTVGGHGAASQVGGDSFNDTTVLDSYEDQHQEEQDYNSFNYWRMDPRDYLTAPTAAATAASSGSGVAPIVAPTKSNSVLSNAAAAVVGSPADGKKKGSNGKAKDHILVPPSQVGKDGVSPSRWASTVGSVKDVPPQKKEDASAKAAGLRSWLPSWGRGSASPAANNSNNVNGGSANASPSTASTDSKQAVVEGGVVPPARSNSTLSQVSNGSANAAAAGGAAGVA